MIGRFQYDDARLLCSYSREHRHGPNLSTSIQAATQNSLSFRSRGVSWEVTVVVKLRGTVKRPYIMQILGNRRSLTEAKKLETKSGMFVRQCYSLQRRYNHRADREFEVFHSRSGSTVARHSRRATRGGARGRVCFGDSHVYHKK